MDGAAVIGDIWNNEENDGDADVDGIDFDTRSISSTTSAGKRLSRIGSAYVVWSECDNFEPTIIYKLV